MKSSALTTNEGALAGFTHRIELTFADFAALTTVTTAQTIALLTLAAGHLIEKVAVHLKTPFAITADATDDTTLATIGDTGSATQYLSSTQLNLNGSYVTYKAGTNTAGKAYTSADALNIVVTPKTATALSSLTAGEIHVFVRLVDLSKLS